MASIFFICTILLVSACIWLISKKEHVAVPWIFRYCTFILPFAAGGYHTIMSAITTILLLCNLLRICQQKNALHLSMNLNMAAVMLITASYCFTPIWAADKGIAAFGIVRYLPVFLYALTLTQYTHEERDHILSYLPLCGALMTAISCLLLMIPSMSTYVTVNGRLSGFMQYPNTFAVFLLAGLIIKGTRQNRDKLAPVIDATLIFGVILSGSRTAFVLLGITLIGIGIIRKDFKILISLTASIACGLLLALAASHWGLLNNADRFTTISATSGTFLVRLLYFKDAIPIILKNPVGLGYMGYRALECTFQTGRYSVSYVHNGFLQLLLDIGWIPSILLAVAFLRSLFSTHTAKCNKLLLIIILGHCMLDFDLQFFVIWVILLSILDFDYGKIISFHPGKLPSTAVCALIAAIGVWLGAGDLLYHSGNTDACLKVTPFHTEALSAALTSAADIAEADDLADHILELNPTSSLAYSAKANTALSQGDVLSMIEYKEQAISCARYATEEYCDYFDKLYAVMQRYLQVGDTQSATYCLKKLCGIPEMMQAVTDSTAPLAYLTGDDSTLELPEEYLQLLKALTQ